MSSWDEYPLESVKFTSTKSSLRNCGSDTSQLHVSCDWIGSSEHYSNVEEKATKRERKRMNV